MSRLVGAFQYVRACFPAILNQRAEMSAHSKGSAYPTSHRGTDSIHPLNTPLPIVDGVGPSSLWLPAGDWKTVLDFLVHQFPAVDKDTWSRRMTRGEVVDESGIRLTLSTTYRAGACIFYYREVGLESRIPFDEEILYEDEHILVVDKPHFLPVIPAGQFLRETLLVRLRQRGQPDSLVPIHRLDRETAGVMVFSIDAGTRGEYTSLFQHRKVEKVYEAYARTAADLVLPTVRRSRIVTGEPFFRMKEIDGEPNTETRIEKIRDVANDVTLYRLMPLTGKKHQLRIHMSGLGVPVVNDRLYPTLSGAADGFDRPLKLLARSIAFRDPVTGEERYFESQREL